MKRIGKLFSEILAAQPEGTTAEAFLATIKNEGLVRVDDVLTALASKTVIKQGPRAVGLDLPDSLYFPPVAATTEEVLTKDGKTKNMINHGNAQIAHTGHAESVSYSPTMPSHKLFQNTGNPYAKAYHPKDDGETQNADGFDHHATTKTYRPLVSLQFALWQHLARTKKAFTLADILSTVLSKAGMADSEGRPTVKYAAECVRDSLNDLRKFGFVLGNHAPNLIDVVWCTNTTVIESRKAAKAVKA